MSAAGTEPAGPAPVSLWTIARERTRLGCIGFGGPPAHIALLRLCVEDRFTPSFLFVLLGGSRFDQIRASTTIQSFLTGAGPAVIGAIAGSAIPLGLVFRYPWQIPVLAGALVWLFAARRGVVSGLLIAGGIGLVLALARISL